VCYFFFDLTSGRFAFVSKLATSFSIFQFFNFSILTKQLESDVIAVNEGRGRRSNPSSCESRPDRIQFVGRHGDYDRLVDPPQIHVNVD